jgi:hypothetical protein
MSVLQNDVYAATYSIPGGSVAGSTVTLTVTAPDGTLSTPTVTPAAISTATVPATQVGSYLLVWKSSGTVVDVYQDQFSVVAPALMLLSLYDLKDQLNLVQTDATQNPKLLRFLASAKDVVESITGPIVSAPVARADVFDGGGESIVLPFRWVKAITTVTETIGAVQYTLTEQPLGSFPVDGYGYTWDRTINKITRRVSGVESRFPLGIGNVVVTYMPGMTSIPQVIQDACGELIRHWWDHGQVAYASPFMPGDDAEQAINIMGYAIPNRVAEMLQPYAKRMGIF